MALHDHCRQAILHRRSALTWQRAIFAGRSQNLNQAIICDVEIQHCWQVLLEGLVRLLLATLTLMQSTRVLRFIGGFRHGKTFSKNHSTDNNKSFCISWICELVCLSWLRACKQKNITQWKRETKTRTALVGAEVPSRYWCLVKMATIHAAKIIARLCKGFVRHRFLAKAKVCVRSRQRLGDLNARPESDVETYN